MEFVTVNHDITKWYKEVSDAKLTHFSKFHAFIFQKQAEGDKSLHGFRAYDDKCVTWGLDYVTCEYPALRVPLLRTLEGKGPYVALLRGVPEAEMGLEEFNDYKRRLPDGKTGKLKELPKSYDGKTTSEVFEFVVKKVFLDWVHDSNNGASPSQVNFFFQIA